MRKKLRRFLLAICITLLLGIIISCGSSNTSANNQSTESLSAPEVTQAVNVSPATETSSTESTKPHNNEVPDIKSNTTHTTSEKKELPKLYDDVFVKYGQKVNSNSAGFDIVLSEIQKSNYEVKYTRPSNTELGMIEVHDGSDFYVYIDFYPNNIGVETIMDINYGAPGIGEVSASDNAHATKVEYSYLIGSRTNVSSIASLREYALKIIQ